ncbi:response regulator [Iodidimonas sp. SYSU 1G8]|uniref:response regulator n=1 Tax=Iodidimonas sp. SYSU 1G8 TaxID=3133967 RepID=UPI0031FE6238
MKPVKVLLVEDNDADVDLTRETFEASRLNVDLTVASDGVEAIEILTRRGVGGGDGRPDLILLDLNLPKVDGRQVLVAIKDDFDLKKIPVVVLTSSDAESDVLASYQLGANCFITKPGDLKAFQNVVQALEGFWFAVATLPTGAAEMT